MSLPMGSQLEQTEDRVGSDGSGDDGTFTRITGLFDVFK